MYCFSSLQNQHFYLGIYQQDRKTRLFTYLDGSHIYSDIWKSGEPDRLHIEDCTVMYNRNVLGYVCTYAFKGLCQANKGRIYNISAIHMF